MTIIRMRMAKIRQSDRAVASATARGEVERPACDPVVLEAVGGRPTESPGCPGSRQSRRVARVVPLSEDDLNGSDPSRRLVRWTPRSAHGGAERFQMRSDEAGTAYRTERTKMQA